MEENLRTEVQAVLIICKLLIIYEVARFLYNLTTNKQTIKSTFTVLVNVVQNYSITASIKLK